MIEAKTVKNGVAVKCYGKTVDLLIEAVRITTGTLATIIERVPESERARLLEGILEVLNNSIKKIINEK